MALTKGQKAGIGLGIAAAIGIVIATRGEPEGIKLSNLSISPSAVYPGETVTISVLAANQADAFLEDTVTLKVGGVIMGQQLVSLSPGQSVPVTFSVTPTVEGKYNVSVDGLSGSFTCTAQPHAVFELSNLRIEPTNPYVGDHVTITVTVTNVGDAYGEKEVECVVTHS